MTVSKLVETQLKQIQRGVVRIISEEELRRKLERSLREQRPLRVKLGLDPSAPDIHLGHTVVLRKLRQFQDLGHEAICIIGDFTGRIGDPSGKSETRRALSEEEVQANAATYAKQIFRILDPERTRIEMNSRWLGSLNFTDVIELAAKTTLARMLERDDFSKRFTEERPVSIHEFFYPLMQAYDSVALEADVELGGTDQTFNLVMARDIQRAYGQEPEVAVILPIIEGIDGIQKMSKSLNNYIGVDEHPNEMFGKAMSIPDTLITRYLEHFTTVPTEEIEAMGEAMSRGELNPRDAKLRLAGEIVQEFHGKEAAEAAHAEFRRIFTQGELPTDIPEVEVDPSECEDDGRIWLPKLLKLAGLVPSLSEARRKIKEGAVRWNQERLDDSEYKLELSADESGVLQMGKRRAARIRLKA